MIYSLKTISQSDCRISPQGLSWGKSGFGPRNIHVGQHFRPTPKGNIISAYLIHAHKRYSCKIIIDINSLKQPLSFKTIHLSIQNASIIYINISTRLFSLFEKNHFIIFSFLFIFFFLYLFYLSLLFIFFISLFLFV